MNGNWSQSTKYIMKTDYKYVAEVTYRGKKMYRAHLIVDRHGTTKLFDTIKEAALCVDMYLINHGKEPINILKRK